MTANGGYAPLDWDDDGCVVVDGVTFVTQECTDEPPPGALFLMKTRPLVEALDEILRRVRPHNVFELGVNRGGSVGFICHVARPRKHVAIELGPAPPALDAWLAEHDDTGAVRTYYGVDQADRARVLEIFRAEFGDEPLDLVIDDASHLFAETRASFNVLFPLLRPGGLYVIEDWSWVHLLESVVLANTDALTAEGKIPADAPDPGELAGRSPARLLVEQVLALAGPLGLVDRLEVDRYIAVLTHGDAVVDPETFDVGASYGPAGRSLATPAPASPPAVG